MKYTSTQEGGYKPFSAHRYARSTEGKSYIVLGAQVDLEGRTGDVDPGTIARRHGLEGPECLLLAHGQKIPDGRWVVYTLNRQAELERVEVLEGPELEAPVGPVEAVKEPEAPTPDCPLVASILVGPVKPEGHKVRKARGAKGSKGPEGAAA